MNGQYVWVRVEKGEQIRIGFGRTFGEAMARIAVEWLEQQ